MSDEADHEIMLKIGKHLAEVFCDRPEEILLWLTQEHKFLGDLSPCDMITMGKEERLLKLIENLRGGNIA